MSHEWQVGTEWGALHYVAHRSQDGGSRDAIGVGPGEDLIGPFNTSHLAAIVATALANAYKLGQREGRAEVYDDLCGHQLVLQSAANLDCSTAEAVELVSQARYAMGDSGSNDSEHESLEALTDFICRLLDISEDEDGDVQVTSTVKVVSDEYPNGALVEMPDEDQATRDARMLREGFVPAGDGQYRHYGWIPRSGDVTRPEGQYP